MTGAFSKRSQFIEIVKVLNLKYGVIEIRGGCFSWVMSQPIS